MKCKYKLRNKYIFVYVLVKAPVRGLYGKYSMRGTVEKLIQHEV